MLRKNPSQSYGASPAILNHTVVYLPPDSRPSGKSWKRLQPDISKRNT